MEKIERARTIVDHLLALEDRFGRYGPPRAKHTSVPARLISDDPRWEARVSRAYEKDPAGGENWDLLELTIYGQQRVTLAFRGQDLILRYYRPGVWERIFLIPDTGDTVPLLSGSVDSRSPRASGNREVE